VTAITGRRAALTRHARRRSATGRPRREAKVTTFTRRAVLRLLRWPSTTANATEVIVTNSEKPSLGEDISTRELADEQLDRVVGGDTSNYTNMMQMMSQILQMLEATSKSIVGNIR
jgi:hypothetical protein